MDGTVRCAAIARTSSAARFSSSARSVRRVAATSASGTPRTAIALISRASGTRRRSSARPRVVRNTCALAPIAGHGSPHHVPQCLHRLQRGERRRLHHARLVGQFPLREPITLPKHAQERPVADRHPVSGEPPLERAVQRADRVLDEVCEPVVRARGPPASQDALGVRQGGARPLRFHLLRHWSRAVGTPHRPIDTTGGSGYRYLEI